MKELEELKRENDRLRLLADQDLLTGLLNRGAMEAKISGLLEGNASGVFLMMDVDEFKYINDKFGHPAGDLALRELARVIAETFGREGLTGRMGGDEFAVFLPDVPDGPGRRAGEVLSERVERLKAAAILAGEGLGMGSRLRITAGAEFAGPGDTFFSLYQRADMAMRAGKRSRKKALYLYEPSMESGGSRYGETAEYAAASVDMKYISDQLKENAIVDGAYCQDYDTFLAIYRFLERGLNRTGLRVHLILMSLTDQHGAFVRLEERESLVGRLRESIRSSLRFSDIYTQYSSCQFLAMAVCATQENMDVITARIEQAFRVREPDRPDIRLSFSFYPLQPILRGVPACSMFGPRPKEDEDGKTAPGK